MYWLWCHRRGYGWWRTFATESRGWSAKPGAGRRRGQRLMYLQPMRAMPARGRWPMLPENIAWAPKLTTALHCRFNTGGWTSCRQQPRNQQMLPVSFWKGAWDQGVPCSQVRKTRSLLCSFTNSIIRREAGEVRGPMRDRTFMQGRQAHPKGTMLVFEED